jgi:hypothetical protein
MERRNANACIRRMGCQNRSQARDAERTPAEIFGKENELIFFSPHLPFPQSGNWGRHEPIRVSSVAKLAAGQLQCRIHLFIRRSLVFLPVVGTTRWR